MLISSYIPYALAGYLVAIAGLLVYRPAVTAPLRRWLDGTVALAVLGALFHLSLLAPAYLGDHPKGPPDLVVVSLNLRLGHGDAGEAVQLLRTQKAQVAVLEEVNDGLAERLLAAGISEVLPYSAGKAAPGASGTLIFSAYPLRDEVSVPLHHGSYRVKVAAPKPFWLVAVHAGQPISAPTEWQSDWKTLNKVVPALDGSVILAGDFNTTLDHGPMRTLLGRGFVDAAREANSGWQPTWPRELGLIAIDHVISRGAYGAVSTSTYVVRGTDHRALVARLALR